MADPVNVGASRSSKGVDQRLLDIIANAKLSLPAGYSIQIARGGGVATRGGKSSYHLSGKAIDVEIYDANGNKLSNYQNASTFAIYQKFADAARAYQMQQYPALKGAFNWGGYFSGKLGSKYGAMDLMHFSVGPSEKGQAGDWQHGLYPKWAQRWGVTDARTGNPLSTRIAQTVTRAPGKIGSAIGTTLTSPIRALTSASKDLSTPNGSAYIMPGGAPWPPESYTNQGQAPQFAKDYYAPIEPAVLPGNANRIFADPTATPSPTPRSSPASTPSARAIADFWAVLPEPSPSPSSSQLGPASDPFRYSPPGDISLPTSPADFSGALSAQPQSPGGFGPADFAQWSPNLSSNFLNAIGPADAARPGFVDPSSVVPQGDWPTFNPAPANEQFSPVNWFTPYNSEASQLSPVGGVNSQTPSQAIGAQLSSMRQSGGLLGPAFISASDSYSYSSPNRYWFVLLGHICHKR